MTLRNMKFRVSSPSQSEALQSVLFSLGYKWPSGAAVSNTGAEYLYTYNNAILNYGEFLSTFEDKINQEHDTEAFIERHRHNADNILAANVKLSARSLEDAYDDKSSENIFETAKQPDNNACPWLDNYGEMPVEDGSTRVDVEFRDGDVDVAEQANYWDWKFHTGEWPSEIVKWRCHNASDYFKQPKTPAKHNGEEGYLCPVGKAQRDYQKAILENVPADEDEQPVKRNKYMREIKPGIYCDVYDVLRAFEVTDGALAHMVKKCLAVGKRGHKNATEDYADIVASAIRAQELNKEWNV